MPEIGYAEFVKVDIRTGTIVEVRAFPEAVAYRQPGV